jgi:lipopolysaccharide transport system permease protein
VTDNLMLTSKPQPNPNPPVKVIKPPKGWASLELRKLWEYRELLYFLIWRDVKVRYKQTVLGGIWAVLQPFLTMVVFSLIFGYLAKVPSDGMPYPVFTFTALLPWMLFSRAVSESGNSLILNQQLITKVYFPRLIIPLASVLSGLVDFAIGFIVLLGLMLFYGITPTIAILTLPLFLLLEIVTGFAVGIWLAALNVQYRDVRYTIPFLVQFWLFLTPIAYSNSLIPEAWRTIYALNPMAGVVEGFRWALLGSQGSINALIFVSLAVVICLLVSGLFYFRRMEQTFSDVI